MRDERGFTLTELIVTMGLMTVILGAVLVTFEGMQSQSRRTSLQNDAMESARRSVEQVSRELRNAVAAGSPVLESVERAQPYDLVFQTVGAGTASTVNPTGRQRVRYCLKSNAAGVGQLVRQVQQFPGAPNTLPSGDTACPLGGWTQTQVVAQDLTNTYDGQSRALFSYRFSGATTDLKDLVGVSPELFVDATPGTAAPKEARLRSGVVLRNANQPPVALFTASAVNGRIVLNATAAFDPERQALTYEWYLDGASTPTLTGVSQETSALSPGNHTVRLVVKDPAGASHEQTQSVGVA